MANQVKRLTVPTADRAELERRVRSQTGQARDAQRGPAGLVDAPRSGRPRQITSEQRFAIWFASSTIRRRSWGSRTGRRGRWPATSASITPPSPDCGSSGDCSRGG